ncbi:MAG: hypothetical protein ACH36H_00255 [Candidatus Nanopelagicales bacterium]
MGRVLAGVAASAVFGASALLGAGPALAEGPGYGGNAGDLSVTWTDPGTAVVAAPFDPPVVPPGGGPSQDPDRVGVVQGPNLTIVGLGFRQLTKIKVQVGEVADLERKTDTTGTLEVTVPAARTEGVPPGASVLAVGLSPSGTTRTLVGSVPPKPSGLAPSTFVPWVVGAFAVIGAAVALTRVRRQRRNAGASTAQEGP